MCCPVRNALWCLSAMHVETPAKTSAHTTTDTTTRVYKPAHTQISAVSFRKTCCKLLFSHYTHDHNQTNPAPFSLSCLLPAPTHTATPLSAFPTSISHLYSLGCIGILKCRGSDLQQGSVHSAGFAKHQWSRISSLFPAWDKIEKK